MDSTLTYESVLELIKQQSIIFRQDLVESRIEFEKKLEQGYEKSSVEFEKKLEQGYEKSRLEFKEELKESRKEFDSRFRKFDSNWGRFIESLVRPGLIDLFDKHDIHLRATYANIFEFKDKIRYYEIDLLAVNDIYAVVVEIKTTLTVEDVNEHLERMQKIQELPPRDFNLKGKSILGAVAGISIKAEADKYAQKKGLYVLTQKGNLLDMLNPMHPKEWKIE